MAWRGLRPRRDEDGRDREHRGGDQRPPGMLARPAPPRASPADITEERDAADIAEPNEAAEATENAEATEPIEPIENAEPTEPIESTEPFEPIDRNESSRPERERGIVVARRACPQSRTGDHSGA